MDRTGLTAWAIRDHIYLAGNASRELHDSAVDREARNHGARHLGFALGVMLDSYRTAVAKAAQHTGSSGSPESPDLGRLRDLVAHYDAYAAGKGYMQTGEKNTPTLLAAGPASFVLDLADDRTLLIHVGGSSQGNGPGITVNATAALETLDAAARPLVAMLDADMGADPPYSG